VKLVEETRSIPNYSYQVRQFCGRGFICVGDSHRFIDPIFSFGLYVSICEAVQAAAAAKSYLEGNNRDAANPFKAHELHVESGIDILEDLMDTFWEFPLAFAQMLHRSHHDEALDLFAGRLWDRQPSSCVAAMRSLLKRERTYHGDDYSVPIGSRYHPERASIWHAQV
jgi:flavin-dependent dehydrogenase